MHWFNFVIIPYYATHIKLVWYFLLSSVIYLYIVDDVLEQGELWKKIDDKIIEQKQNTAELGEKLSEELNDIPHNQFIYIIDVALNI